MRIADLVHAPETYSGDPQHPSGMGKEDHVRRTTLKDQQDGEVEAGTAIHPDGTELVRQLEGIRNQKVDVTYTTTNPNGGDALIIVTLKVSAHLALPSPKPPAPLETVEAWKTRRRPHLS